MADCLLAPAAWLRCPGTAVCPNAAPPLGRRQVATDAQARRESATAERSEPEDRVFGSATAVLLVSSGCPGTASVPSLPTDSASTVVVHSGAELDRARALLLITAFGVGDLAAPGRMSKDSAAGPPHRSQSGPRGAGFLLKPAASAGRGAPFSHWPPPSWRLCPLGFPSSRPNAGAESGAKRRF